MQALIIHDRWSFHCSRDGVSKDQADIHVKIIFMWWRPGCRCRSPDMQAMAKLVLARLGMYGVLISR